jgi:2-dehydropantoate 2-reductase
VTEDLASAHWEKLIWNIPFNGLGVAGCAGLEVFSSGHLQAEMSRQACLTTDKLLTDPRWEAIVRELMYEVVAASRALGLNVSSALIEKQVERTRTMGAYKASTLIDFERGQPIELESLFMEPLRQAARAGVATPRLERLCAVLKTLSALTALGLNS